MNPLRIVATGALLTAALACGASGLLAENAWHVRAAKAIVGGSPVQFPQAPARDPHALVWQARFRLQQGDPEAAVELLRNLPADRAGAALVHHLSGEACWSAGQEEAAIAEWRQAGAALRLVRAGKQASDTGKQDVALAAYRAAWESEPTQAALPFAAYLSQQAKRSDAETVLRQALAQMTRTASAEALSLKVSLAGVLSDEARWDEAAGVLREIVAVQPENADAHIGLGRALAALGDPAAAFAEIRHGIDLRPGASSGYEVMAAVLNAQGRYADAELSYQDAIARSAGVPWWLWSERGNNAVAAGRYEFAAGCYRQALATADIGASAKADLYAALAQALSQSDQTQEALAAYKQALALDPGRSAFRAAIARLEASQP